MALHISKLRTLVLSLESRHEHRVCSAHLGSHSQQPSAISHGAMVLSPIPNSQKLWEAQDALLTVAFHT